MKLGVQILDLSVIWLTLFRGLTSQSIHPPPPALIYESTCFNFVFVCLSWDQIRSYIWHLALCLSYGGCSIKWYLREKDGRLVPCFLFTVEDPWVPGFCTVSPSLKLVPVGKGRGNLLTGSSSLTPAMQASHTQPRILGHLLEELRVI